MSFSPRHCQKIAIAGAGLLGRLLAWRLARQGHKITLFDAGDPHHSRAAAFTAAAMISPMSEVVVSERAIYDMGIHSLGLWQQWFADLPAQFAPLFQRNGSLVVAHPQDEAELHQFYQDLRFHLGSANNALWLDGSALRELEPDLNDGFQQGLYLPDEGFLHNREFLDLLLDQLLELGVPLHSHSPVHFDANTGLTAEGAPEDYDLWFDCRGMGGREDGQRVRGVRGEVIWVHTPEVNLSRPVRLMHPRYKLYVVPKPGNRFILGATEIESEDTSPMSVQSALELCSALYTINPAFAEARIEEIDTNLRPSLMDNMPCVETCDGNTPVVRINGLYRHGYLLAPSMVEYALQLTQLDRDASSPFGEVLNRHTF